jgi:hypothetical protein
MTENNEETTVPMSRQEEREFTDAIGSGPLQDRFRIFLEYTDQPCSFDEWLDR